MLTTDQRGEFRSGNDEDVKNTAQFDYTIVLAQMQVLHFLLHVCVSCKLIFFKVHMSLLAQI